MCLPQVVRSQPTAGLRTGWQHTCCCRSSCAGRHVWDAEGAQHACMHLYKPSSQNARHNTLRHCCIARQSGQTHSPTHIGIECTLAAPHLHVVQARQHVQHGKGKGDAAQEVQHGQRHPRVPAARRGGGLTAGRRACNLSCVQPLGCTSARRQLCRTRCQAMPMPLDVLAGSGNAAEHLTLGRRSPQRVRTRSWVDSARLPQRPYRRRCRR